MFLLTLFLLVESAEHCENCESTAFLQYREVTHVPWEPFAQVVPDLKI